MSHLTESSIHTPKMAPFHLFILMPNTLKTLSATRFLKHQTKQFYSVCSPAGKSKLVERLVLSEWRSLDLISVDYYVEELYPRGTSLNRQQLYQQMFIVVPERKTVVGTVMGFVDSSVFCQLRSINTQIHMRGAKSIVWKGTVDTLKCKYYH